jgi:hypothetical protein
MPDEQVTRHEVLDAMIQYGGGFVRHLAEAWIRADKDNDRRLREAFPHYWQQYADTVKLRKKTRPEQSSPPSAAGG